MILHICIINTRNISTMYNSAKVSIVAMIPTTGEKPRFHASRASSLMKMHRSRSRSKFIRLFNGRGSNYFATYGAV